MTVTFVETDGTAVSGVDAQTVETGGKVTEPDPAPTKDGFTFGGWFKESTLATPWAFDSDTVSEDTYLYAKWILTANCTITDVIVLKDNIDFLVDVSNFTNSTYSDWTIVSKFANGEEVEHPLTEATLTGSRYRLRLATADSRQMTEPVEVALYFRRTHNESGAVLDEGVFCKSYVSSIQDVCEYNIRNNTSAKALCEAILEYGAAAQTHFGYKVDDLANANINTYDPSYVSHIDDTVIDTETYKYSLVGTKNFTSMTPSLVLKSEISLKLNFILSDPDTVFKDSTGKVLSTTTNGNYTVVSFLGIKAIDLSKPIVITIENSSGTTTMTYSPFIFAAENQTGNSTLARLCRALYCYGVKTIEYAGD